VEVHLSTTDFNVVAALTVKSFKSLNKYLIFKNAQNADCFYSSLSDCLNARSCPDNHHTHFRRIPPTSCHVAALAAAAGLERSRRGCLRWDLAGEEEEAAAAGCGS